MRWTGARRRAWSGACRTPATAAPTGLIRATEREKASQLERLSRFQQQHAQNAQPALDRLKQAAAADGNVFEALMDAVRHCSLGQITDAFFEVGGQYRRNV